MDSTDAIDHGYTVLGLIEIAELLGVNKRTPHAWYYRGLMPEPDHPEVNGGRAWDRATVVEWAARTGRLPVILADEGLRLVDREILPAKRGGRAVKRTIQKEKRDAAKS
jgi:hypothetical protein